MRLEIDFKTWTESDSKTVSIANTEIGKRYLKLIYLHTQCINFITYYIHDNLPSHDHKY